MDNKLEKLIVCSIPLVFLLTVIFVIFTVSSNKGENIDGYTNSDFGIENYISQVDKDGDGIDDQTDMIQNTREYIATNPKYLSEYYNTGYPTGEYGVCTDVVGYALRNSGYDIMTLVNEDILANPDDYDIEKPDINIDFRRVKNLKVYFDHTAISLTTDISEIEMWQGGDIVVFNDHIGIISDKRNADGVPYLIHHAYPNQPSYEEDVLGSSSVFYSEIVAHYRIS